MADVSESRELVAAGGEADAATRLDCDSNKSPDEILFVPNRSGGRLHPLAGAGLRNQDIEKLCVLADAMKRPHLLTLTVDRKKWESPEAALEAIGKQFSRLVTERLGCGLWFRVYELQTKSGDGWPHVHALIDLGSPLKAARKYCWRYWRDKWGIGGIDLVRARSAKGAAKYLAKYIAKGSHAYPEWFLSRFRAPRMVGYSSEAGRVLKSVGLTKTARPRAEMVEPRKRKPRYTIGQRLAMAGKSVSVIRIRDGETIYLGHLPVDPITLACASRYLPRCRVERNEYDQRVVRGSSWTRETVRQANNILGRIGYIELVAEHIIRAEFNWRYSWDALQYERGGDAEA